jgi:hypothetical protein
LFASVLLLCFVRTVAALHIRSNVASVPHSDILLLVAFSVISVLFLQTAFSVCRALSHASLFVMVMTSKSPLHHFEIDSSQKCVMSRIANASTIFCVWTDEEAGRNI